MALDITAVVLLVGFLFVFINYDRVYYLFRRTYKYSEDLDKLTKLLLDKAESGEYEIHLQEHTLRILDPIGDKTIGYLWISNYPYAYGNFYDIDGHVFKNKCISYSTFKRTRALHLKLIEIKKNLALNKQQEYINNKIKEISGE